MRRTNLNLANSGKRLRAPYPQRVAAMPLKTSSRQEDMVASATILLWIIAIVICLISYFMGRM